MENTVNISALEEILGYKFNSHDNIFFATLHPAWLTRKAEVNNFERLEFLGDKVLGVSISNYLYKKFPKSSDGELSVRLSSIVSTESLINLAQKSGIIKYLKVPSYFINDRKVSSAIADMIEAIFAAIFLDSDLETSQKVITDLFCNFNLIQKNSEKDAKSKLQELMQAMGGELPVYTVLSQEGDAHLPVFSVQVAAQGDVATGKGNSKKEAEHNAAVAWLNEFSKKGRGKN